MERPSPYQGLRAFGERDQAYFGGRERAVRMIVANLFAARVTLLYGPSGVGKSSVLHAGVLPALRERPDVLAVAVLDWSGDPVAAIGAALAEAAGLAPSRDLPALVDACVASGRRRVMLLLDQFEHALATRGADDPLVAGLSSLLRSGLPVSALIAIREESLAELDRFKGRVPALFDTVVRLEYLDRAEGESAIRGPLAAWAAETGEALEVEGELVDAVLDAVPAGRAADGIETAQLQLVMASVYDASAGSRVLRRATFDALGGADGIVRRHVEQALDGLAAADSEPASISLDRLVTPSGARIAYSVHDLAAHADVSEERLRPILERLSEARVLRPVAAGGEDGARFEIYHELLADAVLSWLTVHAADREARRRVRRARIGAVVAVLLVAGLAVVGALYLYARTQREHSQSRKEAAAARRLLAADADPQVGLALAIKATKKSPTREAVLALRVALGEPQPTAVLRAAGGVKSLEFTPDGRRLLTTEDGAGARIWDLASRKPARTVLGPELHPVAAVPCPDERRIAVIDDKGAALVGSETRRLEGTDALAIACSAGGRRIAIATEDGSVVVDGRHVTTLALPPTRVRGPVSSAIALSSDGRHLAREFVTGVAVYDLRRPREQPRILESESVDAGTSLAFDPAGRTLLAGFGDGSVRAWSLTRLREPPVALDGHHSLVASVATGPDGMLALSAGADRTARLWTIATGSPVAILRGHDGPLRSARLSPDGRTVATAGDDGTIRLWHAPIVTALPAEGDSEIGDAVLAADGRHAVITTFDSLVLWDALRGARVTSTSVPSPATAVAVARDGSRAAIVDLEGRARVWTPGGREPLRTISAPQEKVYGVAYSPRDPIVARTGEGTVRITDLAGRRQREFRDDAVGNFGAIAFSPDGRTIAAATAPHDSVVLIDARTARALRRIPAPGPITSVAFGPDGTEVIAGSSDGAWVWRADTGRLRLRLRGHLSPVASARFSGEGDLIATSSYDNETRVWDASSGDLLEVLPGKSSSFSGDGYILALDDVRAVQLHDCDACGDVSALLGRARARLISRFSDKQLDSYVGG